MKLKEKFQKCLVKLGIHWLFKKYVAKHRLKDSVVSTLIREKKEAYLLHYIKIHTISTEAISEILLTPAVDELMLTVVKNNLLTKEQQELLVEKNNVLLLEAYLCPKGFFDGNRRFNWLAEYKFILSIIKSKKMIGIEIFKTYVDNCCQTLLTEDLLKLLLENEGSYATNYILEKASLKKQWEEDFVYQAPEKMLKHYLTFHEFNSEAAQMALINKHFTLAEIYYEQYKMRAKAQDYYHVMRKQRAEKTKT